MNGIVYNRVLLLQIYTLVPIANCSQRLPPMEMLESLKKMDFKVNLWEHAFVHPSSPIYDRLKSLSGSIAVWDGLVPDFSLTETREVFVSQHTEEFIAEGIAGFKLDECDNSDFLPYPWSFPEYCTFPSGMDGEQMHSMFGTLYALRCWEVPFNSQHSKFLRSWAM